MTSYSQARSGHSCDACGQEMAFPLFCDHCGTDYPERRGMSPFGLLGLAPSFAVNEKALAQAELDLARRLHPDLWAGKDPRVHKKALLAQALVNEALAAVKQPLVRGDTLLALQEEAKEGLLGNGKDLPQSFLIEQLELQEEIEEGIDESRRRSLKREARKVLNELKNDVASGFAEAEEALPRSEERLSGLRRARRALDTARYWRNIQLALRGQAPN